MQPPIASPFEEPLPPATLSRRIEWNAARQCLVLRYKSPFAGRLRCEIYGGLREPATFLGATVLLPLTVLLLGMATLAQRSTPPGAFSIFPQGFEDVSGTMTLATPWQGVKSAFVHGGDLFVRRHSLAQPASYLPRENFVDAAESARLLDILESLRAHDGANWEEIAQQFRT